MTENPEQTRPEALAADPMWMDSEGRYVPLSRISEADQMKDELVRRLTGGAKSMRSALAAFKESSLSEVMAAKDLIFEKYGARVGGPQGNVTFRSFDGSLEVEVAVSKRISFGPELQAAKALIDECIEDWAEGGNANIRALVEHAFQVNKQGRIDTGRVLGLRKLEMKTAEGKPDPKWEKAMTAISDAIRVDGSATYIRFYEREERTGRMEQIVLNIASL
ncbi:DUF3164 family protein [Rhodovulum strictum]|nr:DUF3164 family protein [Rhodovulum strictum]